MITLAELEVSVLSVLETWHKSDAAAENDLAPLLLVKNIINEAQSAGVYPSTHQAVQDVIENTLNLMNSSSPQDAKLIRLRYIENQPRKVVAKELGTNPSKANRLERPAVQNLAWAIYDQELALREQTIPMQEAQLLPAQYETLFGVDEIQAELRERLLSKDDNFVVCIAGLGGIGKTALADSLTRQLIRTFHFDDVIWLRVEPQSMSGRHIPILTIKSLIIMLTKKIYPHSKGIKPPDEMYAAIKRALHQKRYLIVIDNLEMEFDDPKILVQLNDLANPSKFLLTSRTRPNIDNRVYVKALSELSQKDAAALLRQFADAKGFREMAEADDETVEMIYKVVGGNPLALRLIVGLLDTVPFQKLMQDLQENPTEEIDKLYRRIFEKTWDSLSEPAQELLSAMPLAAEGGAAEFVQEISGLEDEAFWKAIQELRRRSLLEVRGRMQERRYGIHRLVQTFVNNDINRWFGDEEEWAADDEDNDLEDKVG